MIVVSALSHSELAGQYRGAAITAVPSLDEGFGLPGLESVACGTPVVYLRECAAVADVVGSAGVAASRDGGARNFAEAVDLAVDDADRLAESCAEQDRRYRWDAVADGVGAALPDFAC